MTSWRKSPDISELRRARALGELVEVDSDDGARGGAPNGVTDGVDEEADGNAGDSVVGSAELRRES